MEKEMNRLKKVRQLGVLITSLAPKSMLRVSLEMGESSMDQPSLTPCLPRMMRD
jgi:hypothetical protein